MESGTSVASFKDSSHLCSLSVCMSSKLESKVETGLEPGHSNELKVIQVLLTLGYLYHSPDHFSIVGILNCSVRIILFFKYITIRKKSPVVTEISACINYLVLKGLLPSWICCPNYIQWQLLTTSQSPAKQMHICIYMHIYTDV